MNHRVGFSIVLLALVNLNALELESIKIEESKDQLSIVRIDQKSQIDKIDLGEKLSNSVMINQSSLPTHSSIISIRGNNFKATDYYEDGIPLYRTTHGYTDISMYRTNSTFIDINTGGAQGLYSPSATGGEIILSSKKVKSGFNANVEGTLSTNDTYANISASQRVDDWYMKFDFNAYNQDNYNLSNDFDLTPLQSNKNRINSDKKQLDGSLKLGYEIDSNSKVAFKFSHLESEFGVPIQVYNEPAHSFGSNSDYTRVEDKKLTSYWFYYDYKSSEVEVVLRAYYDEYQDVFDFYDSPSMDTLLFASSLYDDSRLGTIASLKYKYNATQSSKLTLRVDSDIHKQDINADSEIEKYEMINYSLSYMHKSKVSKELDIDASLEYKYQDTSQAYHLNSDNVAYGDNDAFNAQLSSSYELSKEQSYYASVAHKNRFASLGEIYQLFPWDTPDTEIKPEKSNSVEVGANLRLIKDTPIEVSLFYNSVTDMIVYQNNSYQNLEKATLQGFEIHLYNYSFDTHELELSYAYINAEDGEGEKIVHTPSSKFFVQDKIDISSKSSFILSYMYVDEREDIYNARRYILDSYSLVDMQVSYRPLRAFDMKVGVKNLLDENWEYAHGFPAMGRTLFANLKYEY